MDDKVRNLFYFEQVCHNLIKEYLRTGLEDDLKFSSIFKGWALSVSKEEIAQPQYASLKSLANVACLVLHWYEALAKHVTKTWREAHIIYFLQTLRKVRETFGHLMKDDIIVKSNQAVIIVFLTTEGVDSSQELMKRIWKDHNEGSKIRRKLAQQLKCVTLKTKTVADVVKEFPLYDYVEEFDIVLSNIYKTFSPSSELFSCKYSMKEETTSLPDRDDIVPCGSFIALETKGSTNRPEETFDEDFSSDSSLYDQDEEQSCSDSRTEEVTSGENIRRGERKEKRFNPLKMTSDKGKLVSSPACSTRSKTKSESNQLKVSNKQAVGKEMIRDTTSRKNLSPSKQSSKRDVGRRAITTDSDEAESSSGSNFTSEEITSDASIRKSERLCALKEDKGKVSSPAHSTRSKTKPESSPLKVSNKQAVGKEAIRDTKPRKNVIPPSEPNVAIASRRSPRKRSTLDDVDSEKDQVISKRVKKKKLNTSISTQSSLYTPPKLRKRPESPDLLGSDIFFPKNKEERMKPSHRKRHPWTIQEVSWLKKGVQKFGAGKWQEILLSYPFPAYRTSIDLKDKWRNLPMEEKEAILHP